MLRHSHTNGHSTGLNVCLLSYLQVAIYCRLKQGLFPPHKKHFLHYADHKFSVSDSPEWEFHSQKHALTNELLIKKHYSHKGRLTMPLIDVRRPVVLIVRLVYIISILFLQLWVFSWLYLPTPFT